MKSPNLNDIYDSGEYEDTDDHGNSSSEYKYCDIKKLIEHQQKKYKWEFIFLDANIDIIAEAKKLGIPHEHTSAFVAAQVGSDMAWGVTTCITGMLSRGEKIKNADISL